MWGKQWGLSLHHHLCQRFIKKNGEDKISQNLEIELKNCDTKKVVASYIREGSFLVGWELPNILDETEGGKQIV
jgi:hypothetical protein